MRKLFAPPRIIWLASCIASVLIAQRMPGSFAWNYAWIIGVMVAAHFVGWLDGRKEGE